MRASRRIASAIAACAALAAGPAAASDGALKGGFTTWVHELTEQAREDTYAFLAENGEVYNEHIDDEVPWAAALGLQPWPADFEAELEGRVSRRIEGLELLVSITPLDSGRAGPAPPWPGTVMPKRLEDLDFRDPAWVDAYAAYALHIIDRFEPDRLVFAIESDELARNTPAMWPAYAAFADAVRARIKAAHPDLPIAESVTWHNIVNDGLDSLASQRALGRAEASDFTAVSFYPMFNGLSSRQEFRQTLRTLHDWAPEPVAFVETCHPAEDIVVEEFDFELASSEAIQARYLSALLVSARRNNDLFVVWWAHRDFDSLLETFPPEVRPLGRFWRDCGILSEKGSRRRGYTMWRILRRDFPERWDR